MMLNLATMTIIHFILVYPFTHKVCKALSKHQLSRWKCPERLPRASFGMGQGGTVQQPCQITGVAAKAEAPWVISGSVDAVPHTSVCPSSCHWHLSSQHIPNTVGRFPPEQGWQEVKGSSSQLLPPSLLRKDCRDPGFAVGDSAHCLQAAESLLQLSPDKTSGLSRRSHILQICRGVALWESCTLTSPCNSYMLLLYFQCTTPFFVWHLEGVKWYHDKYDCYYPPVYPGCTA